MSFEGLTNLIFLHEVLRGWAERRVGDALAVF